MRWQALCSRYADKGCGHFANVGWGCKCWGDLAGFPRPWTRRYPGLLAVRGATSQPWTIGCVIYWIDAQLPPLIANWLSETFNNEAYGLRDLQLRDAEDMEIFQAARQRNAVIISKDSDFVELVLRMGTPPQLLWLTWWQCDQSAFTSLVYRIISSCASNVIERRSRRWNCWC